MKGQKSENSTVQPREELVKKVIYARSKSMKLMNLSYPKFEVSGRVWFPR